MLLRADHAEYPFSPPDVWGREAPLVVEIGFGDGRFTAALAEERSDWNLLAIDISAGSLARAIGRLVAGGVSNVRLFHGPAEFALRQLVPPSSLTRIYVNFPDPWPKARHEENRLLRAEFLARVATRLAPGGALWLTTDHDEYWRFALDEARATGLYSIEEREPPAALLATKYALKWKFTGRTIHHVVFTKTAEAREPWPVLPRPPMPHALMEGELPELARFDKQVLKIEGGSVVLLEALRRIEHGGYVFLAHVEEHGIVQQVLLEARPTPRGLHVGLANFAAPIATDGVQAAVGWLVGWFEARGLRTVQRWYREVAAYELDSGGSRNDPAA
ncbi:MAG: tRNA (guanosine(46)-N7)-methyltransferase TrmB [Planctomycetes bacterium]|nr:tRNA (guanosine(46)-N7)-methyltransferase TrmB [Planctomycetota bacterium]